MKRFFRRFKLQKVTVDQIDDRMLLMNLYATQALTLLIGVFITLFQGRNILKLFALPSDYAFLIWGGGFALAVIVIDLAISRYVPDDVIDDGGINERIFRERPLWHIIVMCLIISICEEALFRGAIQHAWGPYWTSILFAVIHVRYLQHWLMTGLVFAISYGLGWIYIQAGTIWAPVAAHFIIDLIMGCIIRYRRMP